MSNIDKRPYRADGGDISTGRLKEIADNPYGDEEKCWLAKRVLASLEAEPVAWIVHARTGDQLTADGGYVANAEGILGLHSTPLYTTPPAPVSAPDESAVESLATDLMKRIDRITGERHSVATLSSLRVSIVESCRSAMLQGADGNSPVIPDGWVLVPKEPTPAMLNAAWVSHGIYHASAYRTMLAAAPQLEV
ncbi:hypothetical protein [Escherichia coli]|uniref:hypothetical protein n=1 Tax=Escherichia coli TaxID=562 RepID=UPI002FF41F68